MFIVPGPANPIILPTPSTRAQDVTSELKTGHWKLETSPILIDATVRT
ncbi:MAG: hypothetical protein JWR69_687 [Pedosphaera sp.]|nr:hypothetical protein [Pedosphaera sp.]